MNYKEMLQEELNRRGVCLCTGQCGAEGHSRGFVYHNDRRVIHLDRAIATRSTLHRALHELGHIVYPADNLRRFEREAIAERFANDTMREWKIPVPRKAVQKGERYVSRMKRWGDNISKDKR